MDIEEEIKNCEIYLKQIKQYDPDPFYVDYFLNKYIISVKRVKNKIFEEANIDFGLFVSDNISEQKFYEKARSKNDENAIKFSEWYYLKDIEKHKNQYPNIMRKICLFKDEFKKLPEIKIMMRASNRYKDDINQQIKINLSHKKFRAKEELDIEIKRQSPVFLEIINRKRINKNEPKVGKNQIVTPACLNIEKFQNIKIIFTSEIYISVIKQLVDESRIKIKELTRHKKF
jgi:hypothetical protein